MEHYRKSSFVVNEIIENRDKIANGWIAKGGVVTTLNKYEIKADFFLNHFGYKVIDHVLNIVKEKKCLSCSPIMYIFKIFFRKKGITQNDLSFICDELKSVYEEMYDSDVAKEISSILDKKLDISLDYIDEYEMKNPFILDAHLSDDEDRLRDIRFSTVHDLSSAGLAELLDDRDLDKIELFSAELDSLKSLISSIEEADATTISSSLPLIVKEFKIFAMVLSDLALFPILVRAFDSFVEFINELDSQKLEDDGKRLLLMMMIGGLCHDLSSWIKMVFVDKLADDIYYFDASFSNNCLEIELLFNQEESTNNESNEEMADMMFFCP